MFFPSQQPHLPGASLAKRPGQDGAAPAPSSGVPARYSGSGRGVVFVDCRALALTVHDGDQHRGREDVVRGTREVPAIVRTGGTYLKHDKMSGCSVTISYQKCRAPAVGVPSYLASCLRTVVDHGAVVIPGQRVTIILDGYLLKHWVLNVLK